jgi:phosphatidylglycerophosphatase A
LSLRLARLVAGGFGTGRAPVTPGSAGSLLAIVAGYGLLLCPPYVLSLAIFAATFCGVWAIRASRIEDDPGWVVIDEIAGQWIALLGLAAPTLPGLAAAFLLFRVLDIAKPGPVGWADRQHGALGIMADDLIAGAIAAGILWAVRSRWPGVLG